MSRWSGGPGDTFARHSHPYHKELHCVRGSIVFHLDDRDVELHAGDRLDLPAHTPHSATVGRHGVECVETARPG